MAACALPAPRATMHLGERVPLRPVQPAHAVGSACSSHFLQHWPLAHVCLLPCLHPSPRPTPPCVPTLCSRDARDEERLEELRALNRATKEETGEYLSNEEMEAIRPPRWTGASRAWGASVRMDAEAETAWGALQHLQALLPCCFPG